MREQSEQAGFHLGLGRKGKRRILFVTIGILVGIITVAVLYFCSPFNGRQNEEVAHEPVDVATPLMDEPEIEEPAPEEIPEEVDEGPGENGYYIKVNRSQNVVMVYAVDQNGELSRLAKTFVSSVGREDSETPLGIFYTSSKYEALYLVGYVWGHYAVRIDGPYYFHSVPYFSKGEPYWDDLEYLEYNKLGEGASAGCVRLAARDAKWIFDNIDYGTPVEIYDDDELPPGVVKPTPIRIDENDERRGWDPTDPDETNPWRT